MFPILKLPSVALRQVLDTFEIQVLVLLSFCSSRTCQIVKMTRSMTIGLKLHADCVNDRINVWSNNKCTWTLVAVKQDHPCLTSKGTVKIRGETVSIGEIHCSKALVKCMATFWKDLNCGLQAIMEHLRDVFRVNIHRVYFDRDTFWIMDWIRERQNVVQEAQTKWESLSSEEFDKILKTCKAKELLLNSNPGDDFKYTGGLEGRVSINISHGKWLTLENLLEINAPDIYVGFSLLTENDVNQLLKKWLAGGLPKLKYLRVNLNHPDSNVIYAGLEHYFVEAKPGRTIERDWSSEFRGDKDIRRSDGTTASIETFFYNFTMVVWSDTSA